MAGFELEDFSNLRAKSTDRVSVPLNGETYWATPEPEADVVLVGMGTMTPEMMDATAAATEANKLGKGEEWAAANPRLAMLAQSATLSQTARAAHFLQEVLEPESAERWSEAMRPPPEDASDAERKAHQARRITLPQMMAVYRALIGAYAGGRPTTPPSSSRTGRGGTGRSSTAGRSRKA